VLKYFEEFHYWLHS